jgi:hypothetical protein
VAFLLQTLIATSLLLNASPSTALNTNPGKPYFPIQKAILIYIYHCSFDDGYITWINDGTAAWTLNGNGMGADTLTEIGARQVPGEPMASRSPHNEAGRY